MQNQRALAAAFAAAAVLGFAAPVDVADAVGNGGSTSESSAGIVPGNGNSGNVDPHGHFDGNRNRGRDNSDRDQSGGDDSGQGDDNWNGIGDDDSGSRSGDSGTRSDDSGSRSGDSGARGDDSARRSDDSGTRGDDSARRSDDSDTRGDDSARRSDDSDTRGDDSARRSDESDSPGDDSGGQDDDSGGQGDGRQGGSGLRNIVTTPGVLPAGGRLSVSVDGCRGGTMSSGAFSTTRIDPFRHDLSRGSTRIDHDARPGRYDVTIHCDGRTLTRPAAFTVLGGVQGGVGGSRTSGATPADMAIGAGLVASAVVGGGAFWLRRRNEKRS
ncbi:hypothetical protein [Streptomyces sp. NPDC046759]|uniref:hypothetical protein n=1 Tax=Streptomyces sp. NPDC046759 TaxID=3155019 RepID=UPI00340A0654